MAGAQQTIVDRIANWWGNHFLPRNGSDLSAFDSFELDGLARDCGLTAADFIALARKQPNAAAEMPEMMRALNIDPVEVELEHPEQFRDMQLTCSMCTSKTRCRRDIGKGKAHQAFDSYCRNANTLNAMRAEPDLLCE